MTAKKKRDKVPETGNFPFSKEKGNRERKTDSFEIENNGLRTRRTRTECTFKGFIMTLKQYDDLEFVMDKKNLSLKTHSFKRRRRRRRYGW